MTTLKSQSKVAKTLQNNDLRENHTHTFTLDDQDMVAHTFLVSIHLRNSALEEK